MTVLLDMAFHYFFTQPFETGAYFTGKFVFAGISALIFLNQGLILGTIAGGLLFNACISAYYYYAFLTQNHFLTDCTPTCPITGLHSYNFLIGYLGQYPFDLNTLVFAILHFFFFVAGFVMAYVFWRQFRRFNM